MNPTAKLARARWLITAPLGRPVEPTGFLKLGWKAIAQAIGIAQPGDVVVIAGKGHETGQQFRDHRVPFDDVVVAQELLAEGAWEKQG